MKAWRNLPLEKKNALLIALILLASFVFAFLTFRPRTSPLVKLWERMHGDDMAQWHGIAFSRNGEYIVTAAVTVKVWRTKDGQQVHSFPLNVEYAVKTISPDGQWIATYEMNGEIRLWKLPEGKVVRTLKGDKGKALFLAFSPDGKFLATASHEIGVVRIWRVESGELTDSLKVGANKILDMAISPNGEFLALIVRYFTPKLKREDVRLELWDLNFGKNPLAVDMPIVACRRCYYPLPPSNSVWLDQTDLSFTPNGNFLTASGAGLGGYMVAFWEVGGRASRQIRLKNRLMAVSFHPRDSSLLFTHEDTSHDLLASLRPSSLSVPAFWVYGDVLTCWRLTESGYVKCWEAKNLVYLPLGAIDPTSELALSPDGKLMAVVTVGGRVKLFRIIETPTAR